MILRLVTLLSLATSAAAEAQRARGIVDAVNAAAERGALAPLHAKWRRSAHERRAEGLLAHGVIAHQLYQYPVADSLLRLAVQASNTDDLRRWSQISLARVRLMQANPTSASFLLTEAAENAAQYSDTAASISTALFRASQAQQRGLMPQAHMLLDSATSLGAERFPNLAAGLHCRRASLIAASGNLKEMRLAVDRGIRAAQRAESKRLEGSCEFVRATAFAQFGMTDSLRVTMNRARALQKESHDVAAYAASAQWLGYYLINLGRHELAARSLAEAWQFATAARSLDVMAWTALSRAMLASEFHDQRDAAHWLAVAESLMVQLDDRNGQRYVLGLRSAHAFTAGDTATGWRNLAALISAHRAARDKVGEGFAMALRVTRAVDVGDTRLARRAQAELLAADQGTRQEGFKSSRQIMAGEVALQSGEHSDALRLFDSALEALHASQHSARHAVMVLKALALIESGRIGEGGTVARKAEEQFNAWRATLSDSALLRHATRSERGRRPYTTELIAALAAHGRLADAVALAESQQARRLREHLVDAAAWASTRLSQSSEHVSVDLSHLQQQVPDDSTALVEYVAGRGPVPSAILIVTKRGAWHARAPALDSITPAVQRFLAGMPGDAQPKAAARQLGRVLLDPILPGLDAAGIHRLTIVPDGVLHLLPFDALQLSDGRLAVERFEISVAPSMTIAAGLWSRSAPAEVGLGVVAFGDPAPDARVRSTPVNDRGPLIGARREVSRLATRFPGTVPRLGAAASESELKRLTGSGDVLHFAVHAEVNAWDVRGATLMLAAGGGEDGVLFAGEVAALKLRARLVVLSACATNAGDLISGEGVAGLTNAFLRAGASAIVTTLWSIPDRGTEGFISTFYDALAQGSTASAALRHAKLNALANRVPMATWAAFRLVGDATLRPNLQ